MRVARHGDDEASHAVSLYSVIEQGRAASSPG